MDSVAVTESVPFTRRTPLHAQYLTHRCRTPRTSMGKTVTACRGGQVPGAPKCRTRRTTAERGDGPHCPENGSVRGENRGVPFPVSRLLRRPGEQELHLGSVNV